MVLMCEMKSSQPLQMTWLTRMLESLRSASGLEKRSHLVMWYPTAYESA